jgi:hypothetical protein
MVIASTAQAFWSGIGETNVSSHLHLWLLSGRLSEKATKCTSGAVRQSTGAIYDSKWSIFCSWYLSKQIDPLSITAQQLAEFFLYLFEEPRLFWPSQSYKNGFATILSYLV